MKSVIRAFTQIVAIGIISVLGMASAKANSLTTLYATDNAGSTGGAVYFDATIGSNSLSVTSFDINTSSTASFTNFQVWLLPGMTSQGNETSAGWTQVATGSGTGAGLDMPTAITLSNSFVLTAGTLYGIALVADPAIDHRYTNGTGSNQDYSNSDLALSLGSASNVPFTLPIFTPRVWNGTIYYNTISGVPDTGSTLALLGMGALGLIGFGLGRRLVQAP
jgi:hypothetical protein